MLTVFDTMREMTIESVFLRLTLAVLFGGFIGLERERKRRPAGFRTYMLVCLGAALASLLGQYEHHLLERVLITVLDPSAVKTDVCRFGAQVINGIGFLGAGTIIVTSKKEVKGVTTAAGLWASACMGLAIGAGFYECVIPGFLFIFLSIGFLPRIEEFMMERARNMNIYIEFESMKQVGEIIVMIKSLGADIYGVDIGRGKKKLMEHHHAVFSIRLAKAVSHMKVLSELAKMEQIYAIDEV